MLYRLYWASDNMCLEQTSDMSTKTIICQCCMLEVLTKVVVIFWFPWVAVLPNINVCCSFGNLYYNIVTCNVIFHKLTTDKNTQMLADMSIRLTTFTQQTLSCTSNHYFWIPSCFQDGNMSIFMYLFSLSQLNFYFHNWKDS